MSRPQSNILSRTTRRVFGLLPMPLRRRAGRMSALMLLGSLLELCGLASLIPLLSAILETDATQVGYLQPLHAFLGAPTEQAFVLMLCGMIVVFFLLKNVASLLIVRSQARFSFAVYQRVAAALHSELYAEPLEAVQARNSTEIVRDIDTAGSRFAQELVLPLLTAWSELLVLVLIMVAVVGFEPLGALLLAVVVVPTFWLFYRRVRHRIRALNERTYDLTAKKNQHLYESIFGFAEIKVAGREDAIQQRYGEDVRRFAEASVDQHVWRMAPFRLIEVAVVLALATLVAYGVYRFPDRSALIPLLGVFALAAYRTIPSANRVLSATLAIRAHEHLLDVIEPAIQRSRMERATQQPLPFENEISLDGVGFCYPDASEPVLRSVTLTIAKGACVGVVGASGAGKSTLLKVILRFLQETEGSIRVDGVPVDAARVRAWRHMVGYVPQDPFLLDDTLAQNVTLRADPLDRDRLGSALRLAGLGAFVATLPDGVDTRIGERGTRLSGGQRQRVAIARALYAGAEVLIFDEATSALDPATETAITDAIRTLSEEGLTILVVAHRLSTLRHCDPVIELAHGKVASVRSYADVIAAPSVTQGSSDA